MITTGIWQKGRIAAADGRFNRIRHVASLCTHLIRASLDHPSARPKRHLDRFSRFWTADEIPVGLPFYGGGAGIQVGYCCYSRRFNLIFNKADEDSRLRPRCAAHCSPPCMAKFHCVQRDLRPRMSVIGRQRSEAEALRLTDIPLP